jgi:hypothetical protein
MRFNSKLILGFSILCLNACAPVAVTNITGPDGKPAYSLKCSGMGRDRQDCMIKAGELCPKGYRLVDDSSETSGELITQNAIIFATKDYMSISCK